MTDDRPIVEPSDPGQWRGDWTFEHFWYSFQWGACSDWVPHFTPPGTKSKPGYYLGWLLDKAFDALLILGTVLIAVNCVAAFIFNYSYPELTQMQVLMSIREWAVP